VISESDKELQGLKVEIKQNLATSYVIHKGKLNENQNHFQYQAPRDC